MVSLGTPLVFEPNTGSAAGRYPFLSRAQGYSVYLGSAETVSVLPGKPGATASLLIARLKGARKNRRALGEEATGGVTNYLIGDRSRWRTDVPHYRKVRFDAVYPGIDLVYYGNPKQLEYDFVVAPGANPKRIVLEFDGVKSVRIDERGDLHLETGEGEELVQKRPVAKQSGPVAAAYRQVGARSVAIEVGEYDRRKELVIDPVIVYSTLLGGGTFGATPQAVAVDSTGNMYIAGTTQSSDFPTAQAAKPDFSGGGDGFVTKISADGTSLVYSTYLGGISEDSLNQIGVDSTGAVWVAGTSNSFEFPLLSPIQGPAPLPTGALHIVLAKLTPSGALTFSTYLRGDSFDRVGALAVDASNNVYLCGSASQNFPTTPGAYITTSGVPYSFAMKVSSNGSLMYSTFLGFGPDRPIAIAVDGAGNAYIAGMTSYNTPPALPVPGMRYGVPQDAVFVTKLNPSGSALLYLAEFGGLAAESFSPSDARGPIAVSVDGVGAVWVAGASDRTDFATGTATPVPPGAYLFSAHLNASGTAFSSFRFIPLDPRFYDTQVSAITVDAGGNVYAGGYTYSKQFTVVSAPQTTPPLSSTRLYRTSNSGLTWAPFDQNLLAQVYAVSPDPVDSNALVAATSDGVLRTTNSGATWNNVSPASSVTSFSRSVNFPNVIYFYSFATNRSTDGGATWSVGASPIPNYVHPGLVWTIVAGLDATTAYAYEPLYGVYKTTDGGFTWTQLPVPGNVTGIEIASDGTLYSFSAQSAVYVSLDGGATWLPKWDGLGIQAGQITVAKSDSSVVYATGASQIYRLNAALGSWTRVGFFPSGVNGPRITVSPTEPNTLFTTSGAPFSVYKAIDGAATWNLSSSGLSPSTVTSIVAGNGGVFYGVARAPANGFVAKYSAAADALVYSTYIGGPFGSGTVTDPARGTYPTAIARGVAGELVAVGHTDSLGFPVTPQALQPLSPAGISEAKSTGFLTKISDSTPTCSVTVSPPDAVSDPVQGVVTFSILAPSGCPWTASSDQAWAQVYPPSGSGSGTVTVVTINPSVSSEPNPIQAATISIGGQVRMVSPNTPRVCLSPSRPDIPPSGGQFSISVTAAPDCAWKVTNVHPGAISVVSGSPGLGNGSVTFTVTPNTGPLPRFLVLLIGNVRLQLFQGGMCHYILSSASITIGPGSISGAVPVVRGEGCPWSPTVDVPWISTYPFGTSSAGYSVPPNPTGTPRYGTITIAGQSFKILQSGSGSTSIFSDVPLTDPNYDYISLMKSYGITAGCSVNPPLFCPDTAVTRAQMAVFIVAGLNKALGTSLTYNPTPYFNDMQPVSGYFPFVQRIKDLGITAGCSVNPPLFCSDSTITQGQMAVFMIVGWMIANNLTDFTYSQTPYFTDVPANHPFFRFIQKMRDLGISNGCTAASYCESSPVTRGQMAPMIMRALLGAP